MIEKKQLGRDLSSLISGLNYNFKPEEVFRKIEDKIQHISWKSFSSPVEKKEFINELVNQNSYFDIIQALEVVEKCLAKEYRQLYDDVLDMDDLSNQFEILEDIFHEAIIQKMNLELEEKKKYAEFSKESTDSSFNDNPAFKDLVMATDIAKENFEVGRIMGHIERFKKEKVEPVQVNRKIEMLKIQRKKRLISDEDYLYKMSELKDLKEYYIINSEITILKTRNNEDDLEVSLLEAESKFENTPVNKKFYDEIKVENNLQIVQLEDQMFYLKQKIENRNNNIALSERKITEEQWRQNRETIDKRISPLQLEEMKNKLSKTNVSGETNSDVVDNSTGFSR